MYRLGRVFRHEIFVSWTALLIVLLFVSRGGNLAFGLLLSGVLFLSILVHELGHAVVATRLGYGPCRIILHGLGGVAIHRRAPDAQSVQISLAGPAAQIFLGVGLWLLSEYVLRDLSPVAQELLRYALFFNLIWAGVNLLPIYPLDGGHVSEVLLRGWLGPEQGRKATAVLSVLTIVGAIYFAVQNGYGYLFDGILMFYLIGIIVFQNWNLYNGRDGQGLGGF